MKRQELGADAIARFAKELRNFSTQELVAWSLDQFGEDLGILTGLGYSGVVMLDHVRQVRPNPEVFFIDTGFHFEETLEFAKRLETMWGIRFVILRPKTQLVELQPAVGDRPWESDPDLCCQHHKVTPFLEVAETKLAWMSALRRDQSPSRRHVEVIERDARNTLKIYPLAHWSSEEAWLYILRHGLPYHPLHNARYPSIGCVHCTRPVVQALDERSGRWSGFDKLECGLHSHPRKAA